MTNGKTIEVYQEGQEGIIQLDLEGKVIQSPDNPEWSEGLAVAMISERVGFYEKRLGRDAAAPILAAQALNFKDLSWIGVDPETGEELTQEADAEHRMAEVAQALGVDQDAGLEQEALKGTTSMQLEADAIAKNNVRTTAEAGELDEASKQAFGVVEHVTEVAKQQANG